MVCSLDWGVIKTKKSIEKKFNPKYITKNIRNVATNKYNNISKFSIKEDCYKTIFIEKNSFSATACYGLYSIDYAKMINTYFSKAYNIEDDCHFGKFH